MEPVDVSLASGQGGSRISWEAVPVPVRLGIEKQIRGRVISAHTQPGGFSPGLAARVLLDDDRRVFVKAVGPQPNPDTPELHRIESKIAGALPPEAPAPRLLDVYDDGNWVALIFEDVEGHPPQLPWISDELTRVLEAINDLGEVLTPSPIEVRSIQVGLDNAFRGWRSLEKESGLSSKINEWAGRNLEELVFLEEGWKQAATGQTLLHLDIRADNLIITPDRVVIVDWPHACVGSRCIDLLFFLPSVSMQGGPKPWEILVDQQFANDAEPEDVTSLIATIAGFFIYRSLRPPPPGLPTVREFQRLQGVESLAWLKERTGGP